MEHQIKMKAQLPFTGHDYYYNLTGKKTFCLTMDVDWASDEVLRDVFNWYIENELPVTAFTTHYSAVAKEFEKHPLIEIAIHPNFSKAPDPDEKVKQLMGFYPDAVGSRSHRNIIGRDFTDALQNSKLKYDSSKLIWGANYVEAFPIYNGIIEIPYVWEDGVHLELNATKHVDALDFSAPGVKILNIHPVLFFLNHSSFPQLKAFTSKYKDLTSAPFDDFLKHRVEGSGIGDFSKKLFLRLKKEDAEFYLLRDLALKAHSYYSQLPKPANWY
jgi:hypothetical protein